MTKDKLQHEYWEQDHRFRSYDHPVVRAFSRQRVGYIQRWLDLDGLENVLDVGCGNGFSTFEMAKHVRRIYGIDHSRQMLGSNPFSERGILAVADAARLPFPDSTFDLVMSWELLHHVETPSNAMREMARVSRKYVLVAEPNRRNPALFLYGLFNKANRWVLRSSAKFLKTLMEEAGLRVVSRVTGGWVLPNATPRFLAPLLFRLPYSFPLGTTNWCLACKQYP